MSKTRQEVEAIFVSTEEAPTPIHWPTTRRALIGRAHLLIESKNTRIAELEAERDEALATSRTHFENVERLLAENKRLAEDRDGWKREAEAWRAQDDMPDFYETWQPEDIERLDRIQEELKQARAANDARAGQKEDGR